MPDRFESEPYALYRRRREDAAEPFFSDERPCEYCGHPVTECACDNAPDEPVCPDLYPQLVAARNVREIREICRQHRLECAACGGIRRQPTTEAPLRDRQQKKAA